MKKGQKEEQSMDMNTQMSIQNTDNAKNAGAKSQDDEADTDDDDNWFTVKKQSDTLEQSRFSLPEPSEKRKNLTKTKLARKLRKKNLRINKRIEYDDEGNVSFIIIIKKNSITYSWFNNSADRTI